MVAMAMGINDPADHFICKSAKNGQDVFSRSDAFSRVDNRDGAGALYHMNVRGRVPDSRPDAWRQFDN